MKLYQFKDDGFGLDLLIVTTIKETRLRYEIKTGWLGCYINKSDIGNIWFETVEEAKLDFIDKTKKEISENINKIKKLNETISILENKPESINIEEY